MKEMQVRLKNGKFVTGVYFDDIDYSKLKLIFKEWLRINQHCKELKGRALNVPDVFSEALYCYYFNAIRTNNEQNSYSYDCVDILTGEGIQVKSASIEYDCTSFGPTSTWDKLVFIDLAPNGHVDGNIDFYNCDFDLDNAVLNAKKHETFKDQQLQGRRPRLSLKKLLQSKGIKPIKSINILE